MVKSSRYLDLADWRRQIADLYSRIRVQDDPQIAWNDWVETRNRLFTDHSQSPVVNSFYRSRGVSMPIFDYNRQFRFAVEASDINDGQPIRVDAGADGLMNMRPVLRTAGLAENLHHELTIYWIDGYGGGLFLPFRDGTSGGETYGGGRYLIDGIKGADLGRTDDGRIVLDFNFAYNPSCAWSPEWICPLAPPENHLATNVFAGEKAPFPDDQTSEGQVAARR